jgi:hypothetical protein
VLRGECPAYALPVTCLSSSTAELRLQQLVLTP